MAGRTHPPGPGIAAEGATFVNRPAREKVYLREGAAARTPCATLRNIRIQVWQEWQEWLHSVQRPAITVV